MSRVLFVDAGNGAAGDMLLGALVDLGVPTRRLREGLAKLPVEGWTLRVRRIVSHGLAGRKVDVRVRGEQPHRGRAALRRIVGRGGLDARVRERAQAVFERLIAAEAKVHGRTPDTVHLHEAGGVDAIVDVVGVCIGLEFLGVDRIVVSPMTTGSGTVTCAHGVYPVPGPAVLNLVEGFPVRAGDLEVERLTPTGAAILTALADEAGPMPLMRPVATGYGFGDHDLGDRPNAVRLVLGESLGETRTEDLAHGGTDEVMVFECTLDDSTPQVLGHTAECLLEAGALEVFHTPVQMKKFRPGTLLTVLCRPQDASAIAERIFRETSTLGLRHRRERRAVLARERWRVETEFGPIAVKVGSIGDRPVQVWPEYDDCREAARRHDVPLATVQQAALRACHDDAGDRKKRNDGQRKRRQRGENKR